jgi:hypothetical protein
MSFSFGPCFPHIAVTMATRASFASFAMRSLGAAQLLQLERAAGTGKNLLYVSAREKARTFSSGVRSSSTAVYVASAFFVSFCPSVSAS